ELDAALQKEIANLVTLVRDQFEHDAPAFGAIREATLKFLSARQAQLEGMEELVAGGKKETDALGARLEALSSRREKILAGNRFYLKAMNCPHHHKLFAAVPHSYRDLPLRFAEYGTCYRYEQSGELIGLMRVRSMQMNDAHIYMTPDQFGTEFNAVNEMYLKYFKLFGIEKYLMRFSTHDPSKLGQKFVDEPELWKK